VAESPEFHGGPHDEYEVYFNTPFVMIAETAMDLPAILQNGPEGFATGG
jgi:hypothetical protein